MTIEKAYKKLGLLLELQRKLYLEYEEENVTSNEKLFDKWSNSMLLLIREIEKSRQLLDILKLNGES